VAIIDQGEVIALDTIKNLIALLGGGVIHVGIESVDDDLLSQLSDLPGVKSAELTSQPVPPPPSEGEEIEAKEREELETNPIVKIVAEHSQTAVVNVIGCLNEKDISLTALEILEPNLESVFLHLTGKKLRE
jgi:ABC-2 type transport system ATP-binding protein